MADLLRVAVCEDTKSDAEHLLSCLKQCRISTACTVFSDGETLLSSYEPGSFDLLLTDIYMTGMTGVKLVSEIRKKDEQLPVAFVTGSSEHALESYRLSALKYIEKPYQIKEIEEILRLAAMEKEHVPALSVTCNRREERIPLSSILYLEQQTHKLNIVRKNAPSAEIYEKLSCFRPQLEEAGFFFPHKSFAVNLSYVRFIDTDLKCFKMENGDNVPIRRESMSQAKKAFETDLFQKTRGISR